MSHAVISEWINGPNTTKIHGVRSIAMQELQSAINVFAVLETDADSFSTTLVYFYDVQGVKLVQQNFQNGVNSLSNHMVRLLDENQIWFAADQDNGRVLTLKMDTFEEANMQDLKSSLSLSN